MQSADASQAETAEARATGRSEFWAGVRAEAPILLGTIPFGLIFGALAVQLGLRPALAQASSSVIFAGSAQFISAPLLAGATPSVVIVLTVLVVNARHMLYSASLAPYLAPISPLWKVVLSYLLTDEAYVVTITHFHRGADARVRHWFFLGAGLTLWSTWQLATAAGIVIGAQVPPAWALDFFLPLTFIALVIPNLRGRASWTAALVAGIVGVLGLGLPYKLGLVLAALLGILAGMMVSARRGSR